MPVFFFTYVKAFARYVVYLLLRALDGEVAFVFPFAIRSYGFAVMVTSRQSSICSTLTSKISNSNSCLPGAISPPFLTNFVNGREQVAVFSPVMKWMFL